MIRIVIAIAILSAAPFCAPPAYAALEDVIIGPLGEMERACVGAPLEEFWGKLMTLTRAPDTEELERAARDDDPEAQLLLGLITMSKSEKITPRSTAGKWMHHSAYAGYAPAQFHLGMLMLAEKRRKYQDQGVLLMTLAADNDIPLARLFLGHFYSDLPGSRPDPKKAEQWYLSLADAGCITVRRTIADMYANRSESDQDAVRAYMWFSLLHEELPESEQTVVDLYMRDVARNLDGEQLAEAKRLAAEWQSQH